MTDPSVGGFEPSGFDVTDDAELTRYMEVANDQRIYALALAL
jgi:hypothetical protein